MKIKALQVFRADEELEENGKWTVIAEGVEWKIRRLRSKAVEAARERLYGPHERAMGARKKALPDAVEVMLTCQLISQAIVVDWRGEGMVDDDDKPIPFSPEACEEILKDKETGKDLRATVLQYSNDAEHYAPGAPTEKELEDDAKNSKTT